MIRLNLANVPGLQGEELPTIVDLKGLTSGQPTEPLPEKEMEFVPEQAPAESSEEPVIETEPTQASMKIFSNLLKRIWIQSNRLSKRSLFPNLLRHHRISLKKDRLE